MYLHLFTVALKSRLHEAFFVFLVIRHNYIVRVTIGGGKIQVKGDTFPFHISCFIYIVNGTGYTVIYKHKFGIFIHYTLLLLFVLLLFQTLVA